MVVIVCNHKVSSNAIFKNTQMESMCIQKNFNWFVSTKDGDVEFGNGIKLDWVMNQQASESLHKIMITMHNLTFTTISTTRCRSYAQHSWMKDEDVTDEDLYMMSKYANWLLTDVHHSLLHSLSTQWRTQTFLHLMMPIVWWVLSFLWISCRTYHSLKHNDRNTYRISYRRSITHWS